LFILEKKKKNYKEFKYQLCEQIKFYTTSQ